MDLHFSLETGRLSAFSKSVRWHSVWMSSHSHPWPSGPPTIFTWKKNKNWLFWSPNETSRWKHRDGNKTGWPKNVGNEGPSTFSVVSWGWNFPHSLRVGPARKKNIKRPHKKSDCSKEQEGIDGVYHEEPFTGRCTCQPNLQLKFVDVEIWWNR